MPEHRLEDSGDKLPVGKLHDAGQSWLVTPRLISLAISSPPILTRRDSDAQEDDQENADGWKSTCIHHERLDLPSPHPSSYFSILGHTTIHPAGDRRAARAVTVL